MIKFNQFSYIIANININLYKFTNIIFSQHNVHKKQTILVHLSTAEISIICKCSIENATTEILAICN